MGQEYALRLAKEGADLVLASRHPAEKTKEMIGNAGGKAIAFPSDVTVAEDVEASGEAVKSEYGRSVGVSITSIITTSGGSKPQRRCFFLRIRNRADGNKIVSTR